MEWKPNLAGYPISLWPKQAVTPSTVGVPVEPVTVRPIIMDLSDNIMLAHYQRERR